MTLARPMASPASRNPTTADAPFRAAHLEEPHRHRGDDAVGRTSKLSLDARLADLAPEVPFVNPWESTDPVRLVHLLEHTTGWPDIGPTVLVAEGRGWPLLKGVQASSRDFVSRWKPGYFPVYNNAGPAVAGFAIEKATGQTFDDYVRTTVLRPRGCHRDRPLPRRGAMARSYEADGRGRPSVHHPRPPQPSRERARARAARALLSGARRGRCAHPDKPRWRASSATSRRSPAPRLHERLRPGRRPHPDAGVTFHRHNSGIDSHLMLGYPSPRDRATLMANGAKASTSHAGFAARPRLPDPQRPLAPPPAFAVEAKASSYSGVPLDHAAEPPAASVRGAPGPRACRRRTGISWSAQEGVVPHRGHSFRRPIATSRPRLRGGRRRVGSRRSTLPRKGRRARSSSPRWASCSWRPGRPLVMAPVTIVAAVRRRLAARRRRSPLLPLGALAAAVVTFALPLAAVGSSGMTERTGWRRRDLSVSIFLGSPSSLCSPPRPLGSLARRAGFVRSTRADLRRRARACRLPAVIGWIDPHLDNVSSVRPPLSSQSMTARLQRRCTKSRDDCAGHERRRTVRPLYALPRSAGRRVAEKLSVTGVTDNLRTAPTWYVPCIGSVQPR